VPWKVSDPMSERMSFVMRLQQGESMSELCREFEISRKTGYKLRERFKSEGPAGLFDRSRAPERSPHRTDAAMVATLLKARRAHPTWGPKKLRAWLEQRHDGVSFPAPSTIGDLLKRHGLIEGRKRRRNTTPYDAPLRRANGPHEVWCADFKGQFRLRSGKLCYPLTITDRFTRMILCCEALESTCIESALLVFERTFRDHGLPQVIRTDNGVPFASKGVLGLSRLSVRWLRLGIWPERIAPGHPEQNGQHERMHLVLKQETTRPAAATMLAQQERFERFVDEYNHARPHEALGQVTPASLYRKSSRQHASPLPELTYLLDDLSALVRAEGKIFVPGHGRAVLSAALSGEHVGLRELSDGGWRVSYASHEIGTLDATTLQFHPSKSLFTSGAQI
jgi:transposase InsO family protein